MNIERTAVIDLTTNKVINIILLDTESNNWTQPENTKLISTKDILAYNWVFNEETNSFEIGLLPDLVSIGDTLDFNNKFNSPGFDPANPPVIPEEFIPAGSITPPSGQIPSQVLWKIKLKTFNF